MEKNIKKYLNLKSNCPVCDFALDFQPWDNSCASLEICPCCGIQFGYHDADKSEVIRCEIYKQYRQRWMESHNRKFDVYPVEIKVSDRTLLPDDVLKNKELIVGDVIQRYVDSFLFFCKTKKSENSALYKSWLSELSVNELLELASLAKNAYEVMLLENKPQNLVRLNFLISTLKSLTESAAAGSIGLYEICASARTLYETSSMVAYEKIGYIKIHSEMSLNPDFESEIEITNEGVKNRRKMYLFEEV